MIGSLQALVVEDDTATRQMYEHLLADVGVSCTTFGRNREAFDYLEHLTAARGPLDFVLTDIIRSRTREGWAPAPEGVELVQRIRNANDDVLVNSCFRLRHLPIVVISGGGFDTAVRLKESFPDLQIRDKPVGVDGIYQAVSDALASYRREVLSELQRVGLSLSWHDGRFRIAAAYSIPPRYETKYFVTHLDPLGIAYSRLILIAERSPIAGVAVDLFEEMLNIPTTSERDLQNFFEQHPEFLLGDAYDSYWAQPSLASLDKKRVIRPDFVLKPVGSSQKTWDWTIIDLKAPNVALFASRRFHMSLSYHVHRLVTQLKDYADFFADSRNQEAIRQRFGGVVPKPNLVGVIGRLPGDHVDEYAVLRSRANGVTITTYDEILELRRARVEKMRVLGL